MADEDNQLETWQSEIRGRQGIIRIGPGGEQSIELVRGRRQFSLSPAERKATERKAANDRKNPFMNGMFTRVTLIEDDPDFARLSHGEALTETDMNDLIDGNVRTAIARVKRVESPHTLRRFYELVEEREDVSGKLVAAIKERAAELGAPISDGEQRTVAPKLGEGDSPSGNVILDPHSQTGTPAVSVSG